HSQQLGMRQQLLREVLMLDLAAVNQRRRLPFDQLIQAAMLEQESNHQIVHSQKSRSPDQAAADRIVISNDGVLHSIEERQQHHQVEWVELRQLALSENAEQNHQRQIYDYGTKNLFKPRHH